MCCFAVPVSADDYFDTGYRSEYGNTLETFVNDLGEYLNSDITIDEFLSRSNGLINESRDEFADRLGIGLVVDITDSIANGIMDNVANAEEAIKDVLNPYSSTESVSTTDMQGYGAKAFRFYNGKYQVVYGDYLVVQSDNFYIMHSNSNASDACKSGTSSDGINYSYVYSGGFQLGLGGGWKLYGDVRYPDGTQAPTNDEYVDMPIYNFSNATDKELEELLKNLNETIKQENPDLTSMEGLLESIYYRLGKLDSDNDNALLSQVITAIQLSSGELKSVLEEIRDSLTDGVSGDNSELAEKLEKMITTDDFIIDEEAYRNYSTVLKLRLNEKFIFADDLKNLVVYAFDKYANSSENPQLELSYNSNTYTVDLNVYNEYMPTIRFMIAAFTYVSFALHTYRKIPSYINGGDNL